MPTGRNCIYRTPRKLLNRHLTHKQGLLSVGRIRSPFTKDLSLQSLPIYLTTHNTNFCRQLRRSVPLCIYESAFGCSADINICREFSGPRRTCQARVQVLAASPQLVLGHGLSQDRGRGAGTRSISEHEARCWALNKRPGRTRTADRLRSEVWAASRRHCGVVTACVHTWS